MGIGRHRRAGSKGCCEPETNCQISPGPKAGGINGEDAKLAFTTVAGEGGPFTLLKVTKQRPCQRRCGG